MTQRFLAFGLIFLLVPGPGSPQSLPPPPPPQSHTARPEPTPTPKPDQPPTFPAGVEQVTVDVVVTDKKGVPLADLKQDELQITEDGKPQADRELRGDHGARRSLRGPRGASPGSRPTPPARRRAAARS